uniref:Uncharacterized protein n=1 Tax=Candidatus Kentrum sp. FW TaxID=2126338 RepID=A0A450SM38_9GAMM|nr:MAG: hypothetical protein BECKFW1821A_GA0114235_10505 [Candidatus Kentron sp. FW]VFJ61041.1 MAG: hypothetical protein BECKFW1821B_GA0114236_10635 [Candidatus Kentron sp. FW]
MSNINGRVMADVLNKVAQAIRRLDESEIETLLARDFHVELVPGTQKDRRNRNTTAQDTEAGKDISEVARLLGNIDDRDEGRSLLEQRVPNKDLLTRLVRHLDLPLQQRETVKRLKDKIIEATIGYRLRSQAIRGTNSLEKGVN